MNGHAHAAPRFAREPQPLPLFAGSNPVVESIRSALDRIAASDVPVLLRGESGVGKEVFARQLHLHSRRSANPFIKINCAALPGELLESELFGFERGAFTGAYNATPGKFELADGGTLLLDEIGDMDIRLQAKLLHVLQDSEFIRLGGQRTVRVDVRLIAATHRNLELDAEAGLFRQDLYYRLNVISITIPPLRERRDEILPLANYFLEKHAIEDLSTPPISPALADAMLHYDWPGNIRELENVVQRLLVLRDPQTLALNLSANPSSAPAIIPTPRPPQLSAFQQAELARDGAESRAILDALTAARGNRKRAAALLGVKYKALLYKIKKLNIRPDWE